MQDFGNSQIRQGGGTIGTRRSTRQERIWQTAAILVVATALACPVPGDLYAEAEKLGDRDVLALAADGIEKYRKGDGTLEFRHPDGTPVRNARISLVQRSHNFKFGNFIRPRHYNDRAYLDRFRELFNYVQLLEFNWGQYEPDEGQPLREQRMEFIRNWCRQHGLTSFYGHMLVWTRQYGEYPRTGLPLWLFEYDKKTQYQLLRERIQREVLDYRDIDILWDVVNEAVHCRVWGDWEKDSYVQNKQPEPLSRVADYVEDALTWARGANPDASLMINDYSTLVRSRFQDRFRELIDELLARGAPLDAIGIQAHEPDKGAYWYSPTEIWSAYERLGTETGLPIYITELLFLADTTMLIQGGYRSGKWNERLQADAVEQFYRVSFGHPSVRGICYFGLAENSVWRPSSGLLEQDYEPKPAWYRLKKLLHEKWTTRTSGDLAADGVFTFNGFYGRYEAVLEVQDSRRVFEFNLQPQGPNNWEFVVE